MPQTRYLSTTQQGSALYEALRQTAGFPQDIGVGDDVALGFGGSAAAKLLWCGEDANAEMLKINLPAGGSVDVPVLAIGIGIAGVDLTVLNGATHPTLAVFDADRDSYVGFDYRADDAPRLLLGGSATVLEVPDDKALGFGSSAPAKLGYDDSDANANALMLDLPAGGGADVPVLAIGIGNRGSDLALFNGITETTLAVTDADGDSALTFSYRADDRPVISTLGTATIVEIDKVLKLDAADGADAANALLMGVGTSGDPATTAVADKMFFEMRCQTTATSGSARGIYVRTLFAGAGGSGEGIRANTNVSAAAATVYGASSGLGIKSGGSVTGLGCGFKTNLLLPNEAMAAGGTYYGSMAEIWCEGTSSDISPVTQHAVAAFLVSGGDATSRATVKNMFAFTGEDGSGEIIYDNTADPGNAGGSIRILVNGTVRYLKYWDSE